MCMEPQEQALLKEIKALYNQLVQNVYGEYRAAIKIGNPGISYGIYANRLFQKVKELYDTFHPEYLTKLDIISLKHTLDKEVADVDYYYSKALPPRTSRKQKAKVCDAIYKANKQIRLDLFLLFKKIDEL